MPPEPSPYVAAALQGFAPRGAPPGEYTWQALTVYHMRTLKNRLTSLLPSFWNQRCVWAACAVGFYGGLRSSENLVNGPGRGARLADVQFTEEGCRLRVPIQKIRQHGTAYQVPCGGWPTARDC